MADSWTRLSPEGNIISVTEPIGEHAHFEVYPSRCKMQSTLSAFYSPIISSHFCLERLLVTASYQIRHQNKAHGAQLCRDGGSPLRSNACKKQAMVLDGSGRRRMGMMQNEEVTGAWKDFLI